ncbi:MAG: sulfite exporter TauE/SafE family protein [Myxococcota bacterium]
MWGLFATVLTGSLLGSLHCAGMCGGLVAVYAGDGDAEVRGHALYHGGRLATYSGLGALAGALGGLLEVAGSLVGIAELAAVFAGGAVALWGGLKLLSLYDARFQSGPALPASVQRALAAVLGRLKHYPTGIRAGLLGLATGLLPCGWLYAFVAVAAGTGHPLTGALVMASFWVGTVPALLAIGIGVRRLMGPLAQKLPVFSAVALIAVGLATVFFRAGRSDAIETWLHVQQAAAQIESHSGASDSNPASAAPEGHSCH